MKIKKSVWLPTVISIYFIAMAVIFGKEYIAAGEWVKFSLTCAAEIIVIILLVIFLRKREKF